MSCYNTNCSVDTTTTAEHPIALASNEPNPANVRHQGLLVRMGRELLLMTQRRQAGRVRLGRLLDAGWTGPEVEQKVTASKSAAARARSGR